MKKIIVLFYMILGMANLFTQSRIIGNGVVKEESRSLTGYNSIKLKGNFDVILTDEKQGTVHIVAEENIIPLIESQVVDGRELELNMKPKLRISYKKAKVYVPARDVHRLTLIGSGNIENQGDMIVDHFMIILKGSGDIDLKNIESNKCQVLLHGSGDIDLKGKTDNLSVKLKGSGDVSAFGFTAKEVSVELMGSGDVEVYGRDKFVGKITGSGDIKLKGQPPVLIKSKRGSGRIVVL